MDMVGLRQLERCWVGGGQHGNTNTLLKVLGYIDNNCSRHTASVWHTLRTRP